MSELLDAIRNMPPAAADVFVLAVVGLGAGALGLAGGIWASYRAAEEDDATGPAAQSRSERRGYRP